MDKLEMKCEHDRLEHAFQIAHDHLGIERLLDADDVCCPDPEKKSIIMYITSLFQVLPQQITVEEVEEAHHITKTGGKHLHNNQEVCQILTLFYLFIYNQGLLVGFIESIFYIFGSTFVLNAMRNEHVYAFSHKTYLVEHCGL